MSFYNEIIPNLFLGDVEASQDDDFMSSKKISIIINCSKNLDNKYVSSLMKPVENSSEIKKTLLSFSMVYYRIPVDSNGENAEIDIFCNYTMKILYLIVDEYKKGKIILVHSLDGDQSSASFIIAFLMLYKNIKLKASINYLSSKKNNLFNFGKVIIFKDALEKIENNLNISSVKSKNNFYIYRTKIKSDIVL
jgi:protein-tyrosine phosphatase